MVENQVISLYTIAGTGHPGASGATDTGQGGFPAQVGALVDPTKVTVKPVAYPAGIPFYTSVAKGVATLEGMIQDETDDFAICGYSQGAMVASAIYDKLRTGTLMSKRSQLKGAVMMGNPRREAGRIFPGYTDPGGHGIQDEATRLTGTEDLWWEMAIPNDLAACVGDGPADQIVTRVFMSLAEPPRGLFGAVDAARNLARVSPQILPDLLGETRYLGPPPAHGQYATYCPLPSDSRTCVHVASDYINSLA